MQVELINCISSVDFVLNLPFLISDRSSLVLLLDSAGDVKSAKLLLDFIETSPLWNLISNVAFLF